METVKKEAQIWVSVIVMLLIWGGILTLTGTPLSFGNWEALEKLPEVVTVFVILDGKRCLPDILRKCLLLGHELKNERLKEWA
jgi:hypothetical protein